MSAVYRLLISVALVLQLSCSHAGDSDLGQRIAGEIIVKFTESNSIDGLVVEAFSNDAALSDVERSVASLSKEVQLPFRFSRLTSGREVVLEIPCDEILELLVSRIRESAEVKKVSVSSSGAGGAEGDAEVVVSFVSPAEYAQRLGRDATAADALATALIADSRLSVSGRLIGDEDLAVMPDFRRIVMNLVAELNARSDVSYAQANFTVRHYEE